MDTQQFETRVAGLELVDQRGVVPEQFGRRGTEAGPDFMAELEIVEDRLQVVQFVGQGDGPHRNGGRVEPGEMFYTSGGDRIFPKGMPAGKVSVVRQGRTFREIFLVPVGFQQGLEEVLVVTGGVNSEIPDPATATANPAMYMTPQAEPPKPGPVGPSGSTGPSGATGVVNADPTAIVRFLDIGTRITPSGR